MRLIVIVILVLGVASAGVALALARGQSPPTRSAPAPPASAQEQEPAPKQDIVAMPGAPDGFWHWPATQQETWLTTVESDRSWSLDRRDFMITALRDRRLTPLARNNLACGLLAQETPFSELVEAFVLMSKDESEQLAWRHYALQFAALSGGDRADVRAELVAVLDARDGRAGTAALQLQRLAARGCELPGDFADRLAAMAGDVTRLAQDRVASLGVLSERSDPRCVLIARKLIVNDDPSLRRSAASSLGRLGEQDDRSLLENARNDRDDSVADVARQALDRLVTRGDPPKSR